MDQIHQADRDLATSVIQTIQSNPAPTADLGQLLNAVMRMPNIADDNHVVFWLNRFRCYKIDDPSIIIATLQVAFLQLEPNRTCHELAERLGRAIGFHEARAENLAAPHKRDHQVRLSLLHSFVRNIDYMKLYVDAQQRPTRFAPLTRTIAWAQLLARIPNPAIREVVWISSVANGARDVFTDRSNGESLSDRLPAEQSPPPNHAVFPIKPNTCYLRVLIGYIWYQSPMGEIPDVKGREAASNIFFKMMAVKEVGWGNLAPTYQEGVHLPPNAWFPRDWSLATY